LLAVVFITVFSVSTFASSCTNPSTTFDWQTETVRFTMGYLFWPTSNWADSYINQTGIYEVVFHDSTVADVEVKAYDNCGSSPVCTDYDGGGYASCTFTVTNPKTYHFYVKTYYEGGIQPRYYLSVYRIGSLPVACYSNSDCGTSGYTGSNYCSNDDVYRNYKTYTCHNPGSTSSYCSNSTSSIKQQECGSTTYGSWGSEYCSGDSIVKKRTVYGKGCSSGSCTSSTTTETTTVKNCNNDNYYGSYEFYCSGSQLRKRQRYFDYSCGGSSCIIGSSNYTNDSLVENCALGCSNNACIIIKPNLKITESDIVIER